MTPIEPNVGTIARRTPRDRIMRILNFPPSGLPNVTQAVSAWRDIVFDATRASFKPFAFRPRTEMPPKTPRRGRPSSAQGSAFTCVCAAIFWLVTGWAGWRIYHAQTLLVIPYVMNLLTSSTLILSSLGVKGLTRVYGDLVAIVCTSGNSFAPWY